MLEQEENRVELENTGEIELPKIDLKPFIGKEVVIEEVTEHKGNFGYYIKVSTVAVATIGEGDKAFDIKGSRLFGLHESEDGKIGWGAETKLGLFLKKMKVTHYKDLVGKDVVLQTQTNKEGVDFLSFN